MKISELKQWFGENLYTLYPENEIDSFFNILSESILNMKRIDVALNLNKDVSEDKIKAFKKALNQLKNYEPIQYILGETEFYGLTFKVNSNVLIPRPETEELVAWIIESYDAGQELNIIDIGTGSGCIAIALAKHFVNSRVFAIDISQEALKVAKENATLNKVNITFIEQDILNCTIYNIGSNFNVVVSNPPYVRELEKKLMQPNVLENEPHLALFVKDEDPLLFYKAITEFSVNNLVENGTLFFEINEYLGNQMVELLKQYNFKDIELKKDIFNKDRMLKGKINKLI